MMAIFNIIPALASDPLWDVLLRFFITIVVLFIVIRLIYFKFSEKSEYLFSFFLMGIMIFMVCAMLRTVEIQLGIAIGLFAIFAIVRFRTKNINIKNMTYLFTVIGISVINALGNFNHPVIGPLITNGMIIASVLVLEIYTQKTTLSKHQLTYDRIDLLASDFKNELLADVSARTHKNIIRVEIRKMDVTKGVVELDVYYRD